jgi:hypothetical protein
VPLFPVIRNLSSGVAVTAHAQKPIERKKR